MSSGSWRRYSGHKHPDAISKPVLTQTHHSSGPTRMHDNFCRRNRNQHDSPFKSDQNGAAARTATGFLEKVSQELEQAGTDTPYWGEASMHAFHTRNRLPTATNVGEAPTFTWSDHLPDITHLRPLGSAASVDINHRNGHGDLEAASAERRLPILRADEKSSERYRLEKDATRSLITSRAARSVTGSLTDVPADNAPEGEPEHPSPALRHPFTKTADAPRGTRLPPTYQTPHPGDRQGRTGSPPDRPKSQPPGSNELQHPQHCVNAKNG